MAVQYNKYGVNAVVPKLPSLNTPNTYTPRPNYPKIFNNNTFNPEDYYTKALGFLPIDTRYLSNTTNSLAYNSMADVFLNRGAQIKRYGYDSWLNTWYGYIPRVIADTASLLKEQTIDPILAGVVEDGWSGLMRGTATAGMNTLINLGNTLDVFSNPIKGLVLEGSEGLQKGLIGDSRGRKQYDYNAYINTGNGFSDLLLSMGAEIISDPLNWVSFGGKALISTGSKTVVNTATDTIRTAIKTALNNGLKSVDELTDVVTTSAKYMSKETAEKLVKQMFDSSGNISKATVDATLDNVNVGLRKALNRIGYSSSKADDVMKLAESFSQGKASRFKAGLFDKATALTPETQRTVSDYLLHSITDMPDLLASNANIRYALGSALRKGVNNTERALRYAAGATGLDWFIGADKLGKYANAKLNNIKAEKHLKNVAHTFRILREVDDFKLTDDITFVDAVGAVTASQHTDVFNNFLKRKERYIRALLNRKDLNRVTDKTFIKAQAELDKAVKNILKKLKDPNIKSLDDYIKYFESLSATTDVSKYIESLNDLKHILNADMTDRAVRLEFTDAVTAYRAMATKELTNAQSDSMKLGDDLVAAHREAWLKKKNLAEILNTEQAKLDDAIEFITNTDNLKQLDEVIIPYTRVALADTPYGDERGLLEFKENVFKEDGTPYTRAFTNEVPIGLTEHYNIFKSALEDYDKATDDLKARAHLVHSYETLVAYLKQLAEFDDNVNINNATQITNKLGAHPIGIYTTSQKALQAPSSTLQRNKRYLTSDTHKLYDSTDTWDKRRVLDSEVHVINGKKFSDSDILALSDSLLEKLSKDEHFKTYLSLDNSAMTTRELQEWYFSLLTETSTSEFDRLMLESIQDYIDSTYSTLELRAFELAPKIRATTYYIDEFDVHSVNTISTAEELTKLIDDLPTFDIKTQTFIVNLNEHIENELLTYTVQQSSTNFVNQLLGLDETGKPITQSDTIVPQYESNQTGLADLITEYEDIHSDLYQALNTPDLYSDVVYTDVVVPTRGLIERLQGYRTLLTQVSNAFEYNQLGDIFKAGIVDALVSQLKRGRLWNDYTLDNIVEEMLSGLDIFVKTRLGADSVAMDTLLRNAVESVENNPNLSQDVKDTAAAIRESLTSGKAHEAMTDVDNWARLMYVAEHTDNPLLKGVRQKMLATANGKYVVVFDMETTGTVEAAAKPFQISGKVLAPDGTVVPGSEFNYIIKLSENERPVNTVLKKLAPAGTTDLKKWWKDNITNAVDDTTTYTRTFNTVDEAIQAFQSECIKYGTDNFILAGQNIRKFDTVMLKKYATDTAVNFFNKVKMFDSIEHFNIKNVFQLQGMHRNVIKERLTSIFSKAMSEDNPVFKHKLFTFNDIETLRSFKDAYSEVHLTTTSSKAALDRDFALLNEVYGEDLSAVDIDDVGRVDINAKQATLRPGHHIEIQDVFNIEDSIDSVVQAWRSPSKFKGRTYFVATKLDPNAYEEEVQKHLTHLAKQGLLDVAPGQTIMNYFTTGVASGKILLNPRRVTSYEIVDVFDKDKILNHFKVEGKSGYINVYDMERFSRITKSIKSKRIGLTEDVVNLLAPDAHKFIKELSEGKFHKVQESVQYGLEQEGKTVLSKRLTDYHLDYALAVSDDLDDVTAVAAALYFYQKLSTPIEEYQLLGNLSDAYRRVREINSDYTPTPLLHKIDKVTGQPRIIYESNAFSYKEIADVAKSYNPLYAINKYATDRNLYNIADIAIHNLHANDSILLNDVMKYLNSRPGVQSEVESRFKSYRHQLNNAAVHEILFRPDRVDALASEARVRMGRVYFTTKSQIDLTDFKEDGRFLVRENILLEDKTYGHVILMRNELLEQADKTLEFKPRMVKTVTDLSADEFDLLKRCRERMSKRVHNLGLSHGDILTKERLVDFDRALVDTGWFTKADLDQAISINTLDADGCFNQLNANNSIIGGYVAHKALFDVETVYISDPFKQLCYNTTGYIANHNNRLVSYLNLFMNENTSINNKVWSELKLKDQVDLFKSNSDFGVYYIRASETKWEKTGSGFIVEELKIINEKSIELAQKLNAIVLPRQQAAQLIKSVNDFELPKIAQIARDISSLYKVAYLGSVGFLIRNLIDSNYKTRWALDGEVSLPTQIKHLFSTMKLLKQYTEIGQTYTAVMHKYFDTDLDYSTFYKVCNNIDLDEEELLKIVTEGLNERNARRATRVVHDLLEVVDKSELKQLQPKLIEPDLFSIIDSFDRYGPSGGMVKSIRDNIINPNTDAVESSAVRQLVDLITEKSPARFVYTFNEFIEKSARLSMFLQDLDRGSSVNDAIKNVINAHFDYSDKSLRMVYTEIVFPFLSFSYKNMEFWINTISKNPMLLGELENVFRPIFDFQSLYNPDQEAYEAYDYTFDWSKDVWSFEANAPWTMINAARLYHILNGNVVVDMNKQIQHNAGYGVKDTDLYAVFKLSPSFLDAVKMLYSPLSSYSERLLPPLETLLNVVGDMSEDGIPDKISVASLANSLPYVDVIMQRVGIDANGLKHNNLIQRVEDGGLPMALSSVFGLAYVPYNNKMYYYDSDYNVLNGFKPRYYAKRYYPRYSYNGGFNQNYYGRRSYSNPYTSQNPRYTLTRMAQNKKPKSIYHRSKTNNAYTQQYNSLVRQTSDKILRYRIRDYNSYY